MNFRVSSLALLLLPVLAMPQTRPAAKPAGDSGEMVFNAAIGSFKLVSPGDRNAYGKLELTFKGTLLLVGLKPNTPVQVTGNLRKEYDNGSRERVIYHGQGKIVVDGTMKSAQWFGRDLSARFNGMGIFRLYGEFDKKGMTGTYQLTGDKLRYWGSGGMTVVVPNPAITPSVKPKVKID
ncbi:MAG: hypothetical protein CBB60_009645 [Armatimonadetes bacterium Cent15-Ar3]|nr:MAG: hypothetical protein CBB60_009645 [Armatimonadetes bacterium Cent15-Ar3]